MERTGKYCTLYYSDGAKQENKLLRELEEHHFYFHPLNRSPLRY